MAAISRRERRVGVYTVDLSSPLGRGSVGVVHPATDATGNTVAAKQIFGKEEQKMAKITKDMYKLLKLDHSNIVKFHDVHQEEAMIWIFMEHCRHKDLTEFFFTREQEKIDVMMQMAEVTFTRTISSTGTSNPATF